MTALQELGFPLRVESGLRRALESLRRRARELLQRLEVRADSAQRRIGREVALVAARVVHLRHDADVGERHGRAEHVAPVAARLAGFLLERMEAARDPVGVPGFAGVIAGLERWPPEVPQ